MPGQKYKNEYQAAIHAVRAAANVCHAVQSRLISPETLHKKDKSPVTVADFASQAIVCHMLAQALPGDRVVGEEAAAELRRDDQRAVLAVVVEQVIASLGKPVNEATVLDWIDLGGAKAQGDRYWTLDPIDGTKGFLRGEQYAVALALIEAGKVVLGVLGCPNLQGPEGPGVLLIATAGGGTQRLPLFSQAMGTQPVRVSTTKDPSHARFTESVESGHSDQDQSQKIADQLGITAEALRMDSQAKYAAVAQGDASIYLRLPTRADYREQIWDHAAGMITVEEAGGRVTDAYGKPLDFSHGQRLETNQGIIASNGMFHDRIVAAVKNVLA